MACRSTSRDDATSLTNVPFVRLGRGGSAKRPWLIGLYAVLTGGLIRRDTDNRGELSMMATSISPTASIAGQLFGASSGAAEIPHSGRPLDVIEPIYEIMDGLILANR